MSKYPANILFVSGLADCSQLWPWLNTRKYSHVKENSLSFLALKLMCVGCLAAVLSLRCPRTLFRTRWVCLWVGNAGASSYRHFSCPCIAYPRLYSAFASSFALSESEQVTLDDPPNISSIKLPTEMCSCFHSKDYSFWIYKFYSLFFVSCVLGIYLLLLCLNMYAMKCNCVNV